MDLIVYWAVSEMFDVRLCPTCLYTWLERVVVCTVCNVIPEDSSPPPNKLGAFGCLGKPIEFSASVARLRRPKLSNGNAKT